MGRNPQLCVSCTHNCRLFHTTTTTSLTSFFKVIVRPNDFTILYIPPMLYPTLSVLVNKKINLEDSSGRRWVVKLSNVDDGSLAFEEGWNAFSLSHRLQIGDFLVFNCINKLHFDVKIFDETGCERLKFPKKRIRENQHMDVDLGGTQNSIEIISECVNKKGKAQSTCEDTSFLTSCMYQNDANLCYKDPMFEELFLATGDTSHASELRMLVRNDSPNETDKITCNEICTLEHGEGTEQNSIILSQMEVEEYQFDEGLGSDEVEIHKEKPTLHIDVFHNTNQESELISDIVCSHVQIGSDEVEIHKEWHALDIGRFHNTNQEFNAISDILDYHVPIDEMKNAPIDNEELHASGSDEVEIHKEKHALDIGGFHNIKQEPNVISNNLDSYIHNGSPEVLKGEFDQSSHTFDEDNEIHFETKATVSCVALTDNNCLKLPECLPLSRSRRKEQRMVVFLKDPMSRLWPVFYHKKPWLNILTHGWVDFQRANDIKPEDVCVFQVKNQAERIIAVQIVHN